MSFAAVAALKVLRVCLLLRAGDVRRMPCLLHVPKRTGKHQLSWPAPLQDRRFRDAAAVPSIARRAFDNFA